MNGVRYVPKENFMLARMLSTITDKVVWSKREINPLNHSWYSLKRVSLRIYASFIVTDQT